jgi:hypothetical protein
MTDSFLITEVVFFEMPLLFDFVKCPQSASYEFPKTVCSDRISKIDRYRVLKLFNMIDPHSRSLCSSLP